PIDRSALLSFDRRQDRQVSRQAYAPALSRTGRFEHPRDLREWYEHLAADRCSAGDFKVDPGTRYRRDDASRIRHRVRLNRSDGTEEEGRNQEDCRTVSCWADQRNVGL